MNRVAYIVAAATFAALLLIISAPGGMAAQPSEDTGTSMGTPQAPAGRFREAPSQMQQGFSQGSQQMGEGTREEGGISSRPTMRKGFGMEQGPPTGQMGYGQPAQRGSPGSRATQVVKGLSLEWINLATVCESGKARPASTNRSGAPTWAKSCV